MQAWKNCGKALLRHFTCEGKQSGHHSIYILVSGRESLIAHQPLTGQNAHLTYFLLSLPYQMDISQLANLRRCYVWIPKESGHDWERKIKGRKRIWLIAIDYRSATGTAGTRCRRLKSASRPESGTDSGGPSRDTGTEVLDQSREDGKK